MYTVLITNYLCTYVYYTTIQDGVECAGTTEPVEVCGTCGAIYDSSFPLNAAVL